MTGMRGSVALSPRNSGAKRSATGCIRAQWNGALTVNEMTRFAPIRLATSPARRTASRAPEITICRGAFKLAGATISPLLASSHACLTLLASKPSMAAIAPSPMGTASCIYLPRRFTIPSASANAIVPAATCAEYSPRLWPATHVGVRPRSTNPRYIATLTVRMAG